MRIPSVASRGFWRAFTTLPPDIRRQASSAYLIWQRDAFHPSLHFKKVRGDLWSVRVGLHYRAIGQFVNDRFIWLWIGTHADYDQILR